MKPHPKSAFRGLRNDRPIPNHDPKELVTDGYRAICSKCSRRWGNGKMGQRILDVELCPCCRLGKPAEPKNRKTLSKDAELQMMIDAEPIVLAARVTPPTSWVDSKGRKVYRNIEHLL